MFPLSDKNTKVVALLLAVVGVVVACVMNRKVLGKNVSLGVCAVSVVVGSAGCDADAVGVAAVEAVLAAIDGEQ